MNPNYSNASPTTRKSSAASRSFADGVAVELLLGMLAAGDTADVLLEGNPWLEPEDIQACLVYPRSLHAGE